MSCYCFFNKSFICFLFLFIFLVFEPKNVKSFKFFMQFQRQVSFSKRYIVSFQDVRSKRNFLSLNWTNRYEIFKGNLFWCISRLGLTCMIRCCTCFRKCSETWPCSIVLSHNSDFLLFNFFECHNEERFYKRIQFFSLDICGSLLLVFASYVFLSQ